jgi:hypothetical protein
VLLDNDVVADRKAKSSPFSGRFGRKEWIEYPFLHFRQNPGAIVANADLYPVAEVSGRGLDGGLVAVAIGLPFSLGRGIESVRDQVQENPRNVLWKNIGLAGSRIKRPLQCYGKALLLGTRSVIGTIKTFLDQGIDIDGPMLCRSSNDLERSSVRWRNSLSSLVFSMAMAA